MNVVVKSRKHATTDRAPVVSKRVLGTTELARIVAKKIGHPRDVVVRVVQMFLDECTFQLSEGNGLSFRGFGTFDVKRYKSTLGRDFKSKAVMRVPSRRVVTYKMGMYLRDTLKNNDEETDDGAQDA